MGEGLNREQSLAEIRQNFQQMIPHAILLNERVAQETGLTGVEVQVLHLLALNDEPLSPSQLAARAELPRSTITRILTRLQDAGYITRTSVPTDGRRALVSARPSEIVMISARFDAYARATDAATTDFTDAELQTIAEFWRRFQQSITDDRG